MDERKIHTSLAWSEEDIICQRNMANRMNVKFCRVLLFGDSRVKDFPRFFVTNSMVMSISWISLARARIIDIPRMMKSVNPSIIDIMAVFMFHGDISIGGDRWCTALELRPFYAIELVRLAHAFIHQLKTTYNVSVIWINPTLINFCSYNSRVYEPKIEDYFRYHESIKLLTRGWNTIVSNEFNVINFMLVNLNDLMYEPYDSQRIFDYMEKRNVDLHELFPNSIPPIFSDGFHFTDWGMNHFLNKLPHYIFLNDHFQSSTSYLGPNIKQDNLPTTKFRYCNSTKENYFKPHSELKKEESVSVKSFHSPVQKSCMKLKTSKRKRCCSTSNSSLSSDSSPNSNRYVGRSSINTNKRNKKHLSFIDSNENGIGLSSCKLSSNSQELSSQPFCRSIKKKTTSLLELFTCMNEKRINIKSSLIYNIMMNKKKSLNSPLSSSSSISSYFTSSSEMMNTNKEKDDKKKKGTYMDCFSGLRKDHENLYKTYRQNPEIHPLYEKEFNKFKSDGHSHDKWEEHWKNQMEEILSMSWESKKKQLLQYYINHDKTDYQKMSNVTDCADNLSSVIIDDFTDCKDCINSYQKKVETPQSKLSVLNKIMQVSRKDFILFNEVSTSSEGKNDSACVESKLTDKSISDAIMSNYISPPEIIKSGEVIKKKNVHNMEIDNNPHAVHNSNYGSSNFSVKEEGIFDNMETDNNLHEVNKTTYISYLEFIKSKEVPEIKNNRCDTIEAANCLQEVNKSNYESSSDDCSVIEERILDNMKSDNNPQEVNKSNYISDPLSKEIIKKENFDTDTAEVDNYLLEVNDLSYKPKYFSKFNNTIEEESKPDCNLLNDCNNVMERIKREIVDHVNSDSCSSPDNFDYDINVDELLNDPNFLNDLDQINKELHNI